MLAAEKKQQNSSILRTAWFLLSAYYALEFRLMGRQKALSLRSQTVWNAQNGLKPYLSISTPQKVQRINLFHFASSQSFGRLFVASHSDTLISSTP